MQSLSRKYQVFTSIRWGIKFWKTAIRKTCKSKSWRPGFCTHITAKYWNSRVQNALISWCSPSCCNSLWRRRHAKSLRGSGLKCDGNNKIENPRAYLEGREEEFHGPRSRNPSSHLLQRLEWGNRKQLSSTKQDYQVPVETIKRWCFLQKLIEDCPGFLCILGTHI